MMEEWVCTSLRNGWEHDGGMGVYMCVHDGGMGVYKMEEWVCT